MLQPYIPESVFVDLFSGSGSIGIEALSRGARKAYFVEQAPKAISCIQQNLAFTKFEDRGIVIKQDVLAALSGIHERELDVIFMDPPYGQDHERRVLELLRHLPSVTEDTLIVVEADLKTDFDYVDDMGYICTKEKCYKTNKHIFLHRK